MYAFYYYDPQSDHWRYTSFPPSFLPSLPQPLSICFSRSLSVSLFLPVSLSLFLPLSLSLSLYFSLSLVSYQLLIKPRLRVSDLKTSVVSLHRPERLKSIHSKNKWFGYATIYVFSACLLGETINGSSHELFPEVLPKNPLLGSKKVLRWNHFQEPSMVLQKEPSNSIYKEPCSVRMKNRFRFL